MKVLIQNIKLKNSWGKNELTAEVSKFIAKYQELVIKERIKGTSASIEKIVKFNIIGNTLVQFLTKIQSKNSWGKNELLELFTGVLVDDIEDVY